MAWKRNDQRLVFAGACLGMLIFGIVMITLGSTLPDLRERYRISELQAGSMFSLLPLGILTGSFLFGPVADRYGYKGLLIANSFFILLGLEGIAYSSDYLLLMAFVFLIGLGGGVLNGATNALVADISEQTKAARLGLLGVFYGIGALSMPTILNLLKGSFRADQIMSWVGWSILLVMAFYAWILFPKPKQAQGFSFSQAVQLVRSRPLLLAGFFLFFASGSEGLANNWLASYLENQHALSREQSLFSLSLLVLSLTIGRLVLGRILIKHSSQKVLFISLLMQFVAVGILFFGQGYAWLLGATCLLGLGFAAAFPVILGFIAELFAQWSGTAFSIALVIALTGNMLINYFMGYLSEARGIGMLNYLQWVAILSMMSLLFLFFRTNKEKVRAPLKTRSWFDRFFN